MNPQDEYTIIWFKNLYPYFHNVLENLYVKYSPAEENLYLT